MQILQARFKAAPKSPTQERNIMYIWLATIRIELNDRLCFSAFVSLLTIAGNFPRCLIISHRCRFSIACSPLAVPLMLALTVTSQYVKIKRSAVKASACNDRKISD